MSGLSDLGKTGAQAFGGTNFGTAGQNIVGVATNPGAVGRGLNIGVIKGRVTLPGGAEILNLGLLVRALETDANANILSTPTLLTLDNEEAAIVIGQNVPFHHRPVRAVGRRHHTPRLFRRSSGAMSA